MQLPIFIRWKKILFSKKKNIIGGKTIQTDNWPNGQEYYKFINTLYTASDINMLGYSIYELI